MTNAKTLSMNDISCREHAKLVASRKKLSAKQAQMIANIKAGRTWTEGIQHGHINIIKSLCKLGAVTCDESGYPTTYTVNPGW